MKNEKGISLIVLIIMIVVIIVLAVITMSASDDLIDDTVKSKEEAEITMDNEKIKEIMTYELAGTEELIDVDIDLKRIELSDELKIEYKEKQENGSEKIYYFGKGYTLYLSEKDIEKAEEATGSGDYFKSYKGITKSYVVAHESGDFKRLEVKDYISDDWKFVK